MQLLSNIVFVCMFFTTLSFPSINIMDKQWLCINSMSIVMIYKNINILQNIVRMCIIYIYLKCLY